METVEDPLEMTSFISTVKELVEKKVDLNATDPQGRTALMEACKLGEGYVVEALIDLGSQHTVCDNTGSTGLMEARLNTTVNPSFNPSVNSKINTVHLTATCSGMSTL